MRLSPRQYATAFVELASEASAHELDALTKRFVMLLSRRRQRKLLPAIVRMVAAELNARDGITPVTVTTAKDADIVALRETLGTHAEVTATTDPSIIAGAVIERGDERIDASVRSYLSQLKSTFTH